MKYYIYTLTDPRTGAIFYVGKGQGRRMYAHENEAQRGIASRKCGLIREILDAGQSIIYAIDSRHHDEALAYEREKQMIDHIGLASLTNVVAGGGGVWPIRVPKPKWADDKSAIKGIASVFHHRARGRTAMLGGTDLFKLAESAFGNMVRDYGMEKVQKEFERYNVRFA